MCYKSDAIIITKKLIEERFDLTVGEAVADAESVLKSPLSRNIKFCVSYGGGYMGTDDKAILFPRKYMKDINAAYGPLTKERLMDILYQDGMAPVWAMVGLLDYRSDETLINCEPSARYTSDESSFLPKSIATRPFRVVIFMDLSVPTDRSLRYLSEP